jgi:hypothetical protein
MKTKRKTVTEANTSPAIDVPASVSSAPVEQPEEPKADRVTIGFLKDESGNIAFDRMRSATKDQIKALINDPGFAEAIGEKPNVKAGKEENFSKEFVERLYDGMGFMGVTLAPRLRIDPEIAAEVFPFTDAEKEVVVEPTTNVLNMIPIPPFVTKYKDLAVLMVSLSMIMTSKLETARELTRLKHAKPVTPVTDINDRAKGNPAQPVEN